MNVVNYEIDYISSFRKCIYVTFDRPVSGLSLTAIESACKRIECLFDCRISFDSDNPDSVFYEGYLD